MEEAQNFLKAVPEFGIHPKINERVVAGVAHCEPVGAHPHDVHVGQVVDVGVPVAGQRDGVQRQPADGVDHNHHDDHLHHLKKAKQQHYEHSLNSK